MLFRSFSGAATAFGAEPNTQVSLVDAAMVPLIGPGYRPTDADERGIWQQMDRIEEEISGSNLLVQDPQTTAYLRSLFERVGGPGAKDMRIYLARIPEFNAMMFPTGFAVVFSGLLLRMRNEAQLAGVIAHEGGHFLRKHQIRQWRDMRQRRPIAVATSSATAFLLACCLDFSVGVSPISSVVTAHFHDAL